MNKCETCNHKIHEGCNYNQGRCPHRKVENNLSIWKAVLFTIASPFVILVWCIANPRKFLEQAKKEFNINDLKRK